MIHESDGRARHVRRLAACAAAMVLALVPAGTAAAATGPATPAAGAHPALISSQLSIDMQTQEQDEWCWVASGDTIASYLGHGTDQNSFCDLAHGYDTGTQCPNEPGYLSYDQQAFQSLGVSPGTESGALSFNTIVSEINGNRPILTGISWTSGGGHAEVIYGYDQGSQTISFGDPWPSDNRYNQMQYSEYVSNGQFTWDDALYQIGA